MGTDCNSQDESSSWSINLYSFAVSYSFATLKMIRDPCPNVFLIERP